MPMLMLMRTSLALLITFTACSSSSSNTPDAAVQIDGGSATVMAVTCPATTPLTVTTDDSQMKFTFTPAANPSLPVGSIVTFTMSATHNVVPNSTAATDAGLQVNFRETKCLQFTKAGSFSFICQPHGFGGKITVQ
jgi:plastocyanin